VKRDPAAHRMWQCFARSARLDQIRFQREVPLRRAIRIVNQHQVRVVLQAFGLLNHRLLILAQKYFAENAKDRNGQKEQIPRGDEIDAAQIAAHRTRDDKLPAITHEEMQQRHREMAAQFGQQPEHVVREAQARQVEEQSPEQQHHHIESALSSAREKNLERHAVTDERELMRDALKRSMGGASFAEVRNQFENRVQSGELIEVENRSPGRAFTTGEMIGYERDNIAAMRAGQNQHEPLVSSETWREVETKHAHLSASQRAAVEQVVSSQDRITPMSSWLADWNCRQVQVDRSMSSAKPGALHASIAAARTALKTFIKSLRNRPANLRRLSQGVKSCNAFRAPEF